MESNELTSADKLNSEVWVRLGRSKIHGIGVIAIRDIPRGTHISQGDENMLMTEEEWNKILPEIKEILLDRNCYTIAAGINKSLYNVEHPNRHQNYVVFMNHRRRGDENSNGYVTNRQVKRGEEVTETYYSMSPETRFHMERQRIID